MKHLDYVIQQNIHIIYNFNSTLNRPWCESMVWIRSIVFIQTLYLSPSINLHNTYSQNGNPY